MADNKNTIIIKRIKKGGGGHHGGAWKIAYADFVTAMMAFFLLMWLLSSTSDEQKRGIANYFNPIAIGSRAGGGEGVMGGTAIQSPDSSLSSTSSPMSISPSPPKDSGYGGDGVQATDEEADDGIGANGDIDEEAMMKQAAEKAHQEAEEAKKEAEAKQAETPYEQEQRLFEEVKQQIQETMKSSPELMELLDNVVFEDTPEGLRIQIIDQDKKAMFPVGSHTMFKETKDLMKQVAQIVSKVPNKLSIAGHTDATPYSSTAEYSNWELSSDRANACRRALLEGGIDENRFQSIVGKEAKELFVTDNPYSPQNRRISIMLLRENQEIQSASEENQEGAVAQEAPTQKTETAADNTSKVKEAVTTIAQEQPNITVTEPAPSAEPPATEN